MKKELQTKKESVTQKPAKNNQGIVGPYPPKLTDVPMYDPQTGEPNPKYEKLTGKKNPLTEIRKVGASKSMLVPPNFEPKTKNRFLVKFPEEMKIKPFFVASINLPIIKNERVGLLGFHFGTHRHISDFELEMIDYIGNSKSKTNIKTINEWFFKEKNFNLDIELLDATGVIYEKIELGDCLISKIDFGELNYDDKSLLKYKLTLKTNRLDIL